MTLLEGVEVPATQCRQKPIMHADGVIADALLRAGKTTHMEGMADVGRESRDPLSIVVSRQLGKNIDRWHTETAQIDLAHPESRQQKRQLQVGQDGRAAGPERMLSELELEKVDLLSPSPI